MNKLVKGSIAGAAGIALLLGGAGTLAYWNSSADLTGTSITAGTLTIDADGTASAVYEGTTDTVNLIVPGDVVEITQGVAIAATGDNLKAELEVNTDDLVANDLSSNVTFEVKAYSGSTEVTSLNNLNATQAASIDSVVVTATFDSTTTDEVAQGQSLDLANLKVTLTQIP